MHSCAAYEALNMNIINMLNILNQKKDENELHNNILNTHIKVKSKRLLKKLK